MTERSPTPSTPEAADAQPKRKLVLFIHGIGSNPDSAWGAFPRLIGSDASLGQRFDVKTFQYKTGFTGTTPSVSEVAEYLRAQIETECRAYDEIAVIAHSQGGLVTRRYIADCYRDGRPCKIRRVLYFATPHMGAIAAKLTAKAPPVVRNHASKQLLGLAYDSPELQRLYLDERATDAHRRVTAKFVVAAEDGWVGKMSAWGSHGPGDYIVLENEYHVTLTKPADTDHPSFKAALHFLQEDPAGGIVEADHKQPLLKQKWSADRTFSDRDRFIYWARSIPFIGREVETETIDAVLNDPERRFAWMVLHGPGGMGKSRLALEIILAQQGGWWYAGFLDEDHKGPDWTVWQPALPTLMVIDYTGRSPDLAASIIKGLSEREGAHLLRKPVRIILIEREPKGPWLDKICVEARCRETRRDDLELRKLEIPLADLRACLGGTASAGRRSGQRRDFAAAPTDRLQGTPTLRLPHGRRDGPARQRASVEPRGAAQ